MPRIFQCVSPANEPGNHGSKPQSSLQGTPFHTEGSNIWVGYRDNPGKKYLGVFPSFQEIVALCRTNAMNKTNNAFPRFVTNSREIDIWQSNHSGNTIKKVCCTACSKENGTCEVLALEFIPVMISPLQAVKAYLPAYNFYLKGEKTVALAWHSSQGVHFFQKTDGSLSRTISLHSKHECTTNQPAPNPYRGKGRQTDGHEPPGDESGDDSSLTQFSYFEPEEVAKAPAALRMSLRSSQSSLPQDSTFRVAISSTSIHRPDQTPQSRKRGCVVLDLTDQDESLPIKKERPESPELVAHTAPYFTPPASLPSAPSATSSEDRSNMTGFVREDIAKEYGRISAQIAEKHSMAVFELPELAEFKRRMIQAVRAGDKSALYRIYGDVQVFLITIE